VKPYHGEAFGGLTVKQNRLLGILVLLASVAAGQIAPPNCFGFNTATSFLNTYFFVSPATPLTIFFVASQTVTVDQVALADGGTDATLAVSIHAVSGTTGGPVFPALASAPAGPMIFAPGWTARTFSPPVALVSGTQYALVCSVVPTTTFPWFGGALPSGYVIHDASPGATLLGYTLGTASPAGPTPLGFKIVFNGPACAPPLAEVRNAGPACGGASALTPFLYAPDGRPVLGNTWYSLPVYTGASVPATAPMALFWSFGSNPAGSPIHPLCPCQHHLNTASFLTLAGLGLEPLGNLYWTGSGGAFATPIPNIPSLAGTQIGLQALVVDPGGVPSGTPGVNIRVSNSITLVLGL
jgi:hypothetical protein